MTHAFPGGLKWRVPDVTDLTEELRAAERLLQAAQLAADADILDRLLDEEDLHLLVIDTTGVTWSLGTQSGVSGDEQVTTRVPSTFGWVHADDYGWLLVATHVSPA